LLCSCIRPLKYIYNITLTVQGSENFNIKQSYVIVCNHQTNFDLLAMAEILPKRCVPLTKKELLYWGPVGFSGWLCSLVFIDRKKQHQAKDTLEKLSERMQHEKLRIWVYPEGTRNREDTMLPFKRGAFHLAIKAQVPIVPVVISSYRDFYSLEDKRFDPESILEKMLTVRGRIPCPFKSNITKYGLFDHIPAIQDVGYGSLQKAGLRLTMLIITARQSWQLNVVSDMELYLKVLSTIPRRYHTRLHSDLGNTDKPQVASTTLRKLTTDPQCQRPNDSK
ncbi:PREDICTED: 1-acyl-sn-glycerol-3-phosphate acyltransferase alpha-like, partial [Thamnophis sirtalis]|uniref:1-acyl-sn-glycerol-3-phosphate acyltransferase n=1 Tax=Thamnophis sirtalis TaxID=35019 RepID=A0A6I9YJX6_9SAUR